MLVLPFCTLPLLFLSVSPFPFLCYSPPSPHFTYPPLTPAWSLVSPRARFSPLSFLSRGPTLCLHVWPGSLPPRSSVSSPSRSHFAVPSLHVHSAPLLPELVAHVCTAALAPLALPFWLATGLVPPCCGLLMQLPVPRVSLWLGSWASRPGHPRLLPPACFGWFSGLVPPSGWRRPHILRLFSPQLLPPPPSPHPFSRPRLPRPAPHGSGPGSLSPSSA